MTAPDLEQVLREVSALAHRAGDLARRSPDFPAHEAATIMEALTGVTDGKTWPGRDGPGYIEI